MKVSIEIPDSFVEIAKEKGLSEKTIKEAFIEFVGDKISDYYDDDEDGWDEYIEDYL